MKGVVGSLRWGIALALRRLKVMGEKKKKAQCWMIRVLVLPFLSFPFLCLRNVKLDEAKDLL